MRKHANIFKALAFGLLAFAFYEVKADVGVYSLSNSSSGTTQESSLDSENVSGSR